jgi:hypothetical protein
MSKRVCRNIIAATVASLCLLSAAYAAGNPEDELAGTIKIALGKSYNTDWSGLDKLPGIKWAPLPPTSLNNCLPDGGCFTRQGVATIGGRNLVVLATGARTIVMNLYFRNRTAAIGEAAILAALKRAGLSAELARCPVSGSTGGTNWYRLKSAATNPGVLSIQSSCNGRPCEGVTLSQGADLPQLQPNQLRLYSEQCSGAAEARKPVATVMPHEQLAQALTSVIAAGPGISDWNALTKVPPSAQWNPGGAMKSSLTFKLDPNPYSRSGNIAFAGRQFSLMASGSQTQPKVVYLDENGMHPRGEDVLGVLRTQGYDVRLARCGPVYTESTNNWYTVTSAKTKPVMMLQSIRGDGKQLQDGYAIRLDNTLPKRDPRDRDPGVGGCK